jgi:hypothetical protein
MSSKYKYAGRWRSEAWHMDGGANDEGWHKRYCGPCAKTTEHGSQSTGNYCVPCDDRQRYYNRKNDPNPSKINRRWVLDLYEKSAGSLPSFLVSLKKQNELRALSKKQVAIGSKILAKHVDANTVRSHWVAAHIK